MYDDTPDGGDSIITQVVGYYAQEQVSTITKECYAPDR